MPDTTPTRTRCAIYTRKSTDEGLDREFNSLDAQRAAGEAYIASQASERWECLATQYNDGGASGGSLERPAMQRLLDDIRNDKIDCVVVYKVDRLSRSLADFSNLMKLFDEYNVTFVSVTQQFNTTTSMGRLTLNILLSFAQFEREIISERTRDKIAASRRLGKWLGGRPPLGYIVVNHALVIDDTEAELVRQIFSWYLELKALTPVVRKLAEHGRMTKVHITKAGKRLGGTRFNKQQTYQVLRNITYTGKVRYKGEIHEGEHEAIISEETFNLVQELLKSNRILIGNRIRNRQGAILKNVLYCGSCDCAMHHTTTKKGTRNYHYYVCHAAQLHGWHVCPAPSLAAKKIETFVMGELERLSTDPVLVATMRQVVTQDNLAIDPETLLTHLSEFKQIWKILQHEERAKMIQLLIERIDYHVLDDQVSVRYHHLPLTSLALEDPER